MFEYNGLRYIDTARVEPRKAYSPEKTPPKTPETPHFSHTPFINPTQMVVNPDPIWPQQPQPSFEMKEMSPPVATSERKQSFELENMEGSPGNTLRERNRRMISPPTSPDHLEEIETKHLEESPGAGRRRMASSDQEPQPSRVSCITFVLSSRDLFCHEIKFDNGKQKMYFKSQDFALFFYALVSLQEVESEMV